LLVVEDSFDGSGTRLAIDSLIAAYWSLGSLGFGNSYSYGEPPLD
jgi:hypothetical protein